MKWPVRTVPVCVNTVQAPLPSAARCYKLGQALGRAISSWPGDERVVVMGTGGLSHQLHGGNFGRVNPEWDNRFMDLLETNPAELAALPHRDWMERGGTEGIEMILWLAMRGALAPEVRRLHRNYCAPLLTGYGLLALADQQVA